MNLEERLKQMSVPEIAQSIRSDIDRMETMYQQADEQDSDWNDDKAIASRMTQPIFEKLRISLINNAGITNPGVKNFQEHAINKLYADKWITDAEWKKLDKLRTIRNSFDHQYETDMGISDDADEKTKAEFEKKKERLRNNRAIFYPDIITWCRDDVRWYEQRAEQIKNGVHVDNSCTWQPEIDPQTGYSRIPDDRNGSRDAYQYGSSYGNPYSGGSDQEQDSVVRQVSPEDVSDLVRTHFGETHSPLSERIHDAFWNLWLPVLLSSVLAVIFGILSDSAFISKLATAQNIDIEQYNVSHSLPVVFLLLIVLYVVFFHLTAQVLCGTAVFVMAKTATDSTVCAVLTAVIMVLIVTRFTEKLKQIISYVFYGFWLVVFLFSMPEILTARLGEGVPLDTYTKCIKIGLPILLYVLVFALTPFVLKSFHLQRPFGAVLSDKELHGNTPLLNAGLITVLAALNGVLYRETWTKSLILLTRDFYASPSAFWAAHAVMIALVVYFFSIMKRYRTLH